MHLLTRYTSRHVTEQKRLATPQFAPLTCIKYCYMVEEQVQFAIHGSKHTPFCNSCSYGLLISNHMFWTIVFAVPEGSTSNLVQGKQPLPDKKSCREATFKITHGWLCRQHPLGTRDCSLGTRQGPVPAPRLDGECRATPQGMGLQAACWLCITIAAKLSQLCLHEAKSEFDRLQVWSNT